MQGRYTVTAGSGGALAGERILLIEDDAQLGSVLREELIQAGYSCTWADNGEKGLAAFRRQAPDLLLIDLMLPDRSGFSVVSEVRRTTTAPIIILTARTSGEDKVQGLDLGADDYITKPFWTEELLARIRARLRRPTEPRSVAFEFGTLKINPSGHNATVEGKATSLTPLEFKLLLHLVKRADKTVLREDLVSELDEGGATALQSHISRLRKKLGAHGARIQTVWGLGYRFDAS